MDEDALKSVAPEPEFTEREWALIRNCIKYAKDEPVGLPAHNLMVIIAKLSYYVPVPDRA